MIVKSQFQSILIFWSEEEVVVCVSDGQKSVGGMGRLVYICPGAWQGPILA